MLELLSEASADGATLVVATHDPEVISRFDRGLLMSNGEVLHDCAAAELPAYMTPDSA